jgi:DNA end-binding protein Ku
LPAADTIVSDAELQMAKMLIDQLTGEFDASEYRDEYRDALNQVIEAKLGSGAPVAAAPAAHEGKVRDLMEALRASIDAAKSDRAAAAALTAADAVEAGPAPKKRVRKAG